MVRCTSENQSHGHAVLSHIDHDEEHAWQNYEKELNAHYPHDEVEELFQVHVHHERGGTCPCCPTHAHASKLSSFENKTTQDDTPFYSTYSGTEQVVLAVGQLWIDG